MSNELTGKTVVVIGASSGMGRAVAAEVAARDAHTIHLLLSGKYTTAYFPESKRC